MKTINKKIIYAVLVLLFGFPIIVNYDSFYMHTMIFILFYAVMAIGLNMIIRTGQLSIGQAAFMAIGAYLSSVLVMKMHLSFWISWPLSIILGGAIAWLFGLVALRIKGVNFAILTFAFGEVVRMFFSYTNYFGGINGIVSIPPPGEIAFPKIFFIQFDDKTSFYYLVLLFSLLCFLIYYRIINSSSGKVLHSIEDMDLLAECSGIDTLKIKITVFVIGSMMTCGIGSLYACYFTYISPDSFTFMKSVDLIIINVIGGVRTLIGPIIGSIFIICVPELLRSIKEYEHLVFALVLIIFIYFAPEGISGVVERKIKIIQKKFVK